jgi:superoxide dismutase
VHYTTKNFEYLLGVPGFSDQLLKNHFTLYQGYVTNFNKLDEILVMDVFEHAYLLDYSLKRTDYIENFFKIINWAAVIKRFNKSNLA